MQGYHNGAWTPAAKIPKGAKPTRWKVDWRCQHHHRHRETVHGSKTLAARVEADYRASVYRAKRGMADGYECPRMVEETRIPTVAEFCATFLEKYHGREGLRSDYYKKNCRIIAGRLGSEPLDVPREKLYEFRGWLDQHYRASTVRKVMVSLSTMGRLAVEWGDLDRNPFTGLPRPREPKHKMEWLTRDQFDTLLDASPEWLRPILRITLAQGLRLKEATGLRWEDVDLDNGLLYTTADSKTATPDDIPLTQEARAVIEEARALRRRLSREYGRVMASPYILINPETGENFHIELSRKRIAATTKRIMVKIGRPTCSFHTLRHTCASWMVQGGIDILRVSKFMRHRSVAMTQGYAHLAPSHRREAAAAIDAALGWTQPGPPRLESPDSPAKTDKGAAV